MAKVALILVQADNEKLSNLIQEESLINPNKVLPFQYKDEQGRQLSLVALRWENLLRNSPTQRNLCEFASSLQDYEFCWKEAKTVIHEGNFKFLNL